MCLLTFLPQGILPNLKRLNDGCDVNPDGFGYAIVTGNRLLVGKGLRQESVLMEFLELRRKHPEGPALFHSRITTHGATDLDNCHPFYLAGDERTVIAHNGILPSVVQPRKGDRRSDTRIAADWIPRHMGRLSKSRVRRNVERWMGRHNKMVVLTVDPRFQRNAFILNEDEGHWEDDACWYSNTSYMWGAFDWPTSFKTAKSTVVGTKTRSVEQVCALCDAVGWTSQQYCPWCDTCQDCEQVRGDCLCFVGMTEAQACPLCGLYYYCECSEEDYVAYLSPGWALPAREEGSVCGTTSAIRTAQPTAVTAKATESQSSSGIAIGSTN